MKESRNAAAMVIVQHTLKLLVGLNSVENAAPGLNLVVATCGDFTVAHSIPLHDVADEMVDVWHRGATGPQGKVLHARRRKGASEWQVSTFKRGDWESAFVFTADPSDMSLVPAR